MKQLLLIVFIAGLAGVAQARWEFEMTRIEDAIESSNISVVIDADGKKGTVTVVGDGRVLLNLTQETRIYIGAALIPRADLPFIQGRSGTVLYRAEDNVVTRIKLDED